MSRLSKVQVLLAILLLSGTFSISVAAQEAPKCDDTGCQTSHGNRIPPF